MTDMTQLPKSSRFTGVDISTRHLGIVVLNHAKQLVSRHYVTDIKKYWQPDMQTVDDLECSELLYELQRTLKGKENQELLRFRRLAIWYQYLRRFFKTRATSYVAIEDYSYSARSSSLLQLAEVAGVLKAVLAAEPGVKVRLLLPTQVKKWACHGRAEKLEVVEAAAGNNTLFTRIPGLMNTKTDGTIDGPMTDMADAYWLADLMWHEVAIRRGCLQISDLNEARIEVVNACSPKRPVNILAAPLLT